jgi:hypothetical protein
LGFLTTGVFAAEPAPPKEAEVPAILKIKPLRPAPGDDELRKLLIARYNAAVAETRVHYRAFVAKRLTVADFADVARHVVDSGLELSDKPADQVALRGQFLQLAKEIERIEKERVDAGLDALPALLSARYVRLDAEVQLLKAQRQAAKRRPK